MPNKWQGTSLFIVFVVLVLCVYGLGWTAGYDNAKHKYCTHGESSITATLGKDGKFHESKPVRTGC